VAACSSSARSSFPSFLPKSSLHYYGDTLLTGTVSNPAYTSQGDPVEVVTPHWRVRAVVAGPEVPGEGLPVQQAATYCTWTITLSAATGAVPVSLSDFRPLDDLGHSYMLSLLPGEKPPPAELMPGQTLTFQARDYEAIGEGIMRWAPDGDHIVAKWDFVVEND
jgi:hypothetical protein